MLPRASWHVRCGTGWGRCCHAVAATCRPNLGRHMCPRSGSVQCQGAFERLLHKCQQSQKRHRVALEVSVHRHEPLAGANDIFQRAEHCGAAVCHPRGPHYRAATQAQQCGSHPQRSLFRYDGPQWYLTELYPSRLDLATLIIAAHGQATDNAVNYLELGPQAQDDVRIVIHVWKTMRRSASGQRILTAPTSAQRQEAEIQRILKAFMVVCNLRPGDPLFRCSKTGGPISRAAMGKRVTAFFTKRFPEKKLGITMLRKIFLTEELGEPSSRVIVVPQLKLRQASKNVCAEDWKLLTAQRTRCVTSTWADDGCLVHAAHNNVCLTHTLSRRARDTQMRVVSHNSLAPSARCALCCV